MGHTNEVSRWFRAAAWVALARVALAFLLSVTTVVLMRTSSLMLTDMAFIIVYNIANHLIWYGLQIAMFIMLIAAAKAMPPFKKVSLLKSGGIVGAVGAAIVLAVSWGTMLYSQCGGSFDEDTLSFFVVGFLSQTVTQTVLSWVPLVGAALCAVGSLKYPSKTLRIAAIAMLVFVGLKWLFSIIVLAITPAALLSSMVEWGVKISMTVWLWTLASSYAPKTASENDLGTMAE